MHDQTDLPAPGDHIWIRRATWQVRATTRGHGLHRVTATSLHTPGRTGVFLLPVEPWSHARVDQRRHVSVRSGLARLAATVAHAAPAFTPSTIVGSTMAVLAYQLEPALAVLAGTRRLLIADAVGLGKTLQAGLIASEIVRTRVDARVLILVPAPLIEQWTDELQSHFGLAARVADASTFRHVADTGTCLSNPWDTPGIWVTSPDFLKQPHVMDAIPTLGWEAVIIDEAHTMAGDSQRRAAAHALARRARHVVLLTATPHDGDDARLKRLQSIGAIGPCDRLLLFRRTRTISNRRVRRLHLRPGRSVVQALTLVDRWSARADGALSLLCAVFRKRLLSSSSSFLRSIERRMMHVTGMTRAEERDAWTQLTLYDSDEIPRDELAALCSDSGLPPDKELSWLRRLRYLVGVDGTRSHTLQRLSVLLRRAGEPAIIFTEYRDTLHAAAEVLAADFRVCVMHGGQTATERRRALAGFANGDADVLLATDVASQGLNLQHRARWVIHLDVPWTPVRLEQRIGRVDRFGQSRAVHVTELALRHPADAALRDRVTARDARAEDVGLPPCRRWTRAAVGLAELFRRQRTLLAHWRGPRESTALPCIRLTRARAERLCGATTGSVTMVEVALQAGDGTVLETLLGWEPGPSTTAATQVDRRARTIEARLRVRRQRFQRQHTRLQRRPTATQPGLFESKVLEQWRTTNRPGPAPPDAETTVHVARPRPILHLEVER